MKTKKSAKQISKKDIQVTGASSIGARIRYLRRLQGLSQGDIERATGLLRCYTSRVENGHTVPSLETLERFAAALGVPLYKLFYASDESPLITGGIPHEKSEGSEGDQEGGESTPPVLAKLRALLGRISEPDRQLLMGLAKKLASR
jgi:transcriptional regulator with XRE-family HTH domain